jgi:uncharacterized protein YneF (UPF0154 family)
MKTSNKLILGLLIAIVIGITVIMILSHKILTEKINENANPKIENIE